MQTVTFPCLALISCLYFFHWRSAMMHIAKLYTQLKKKNGRNTGVVCSCRKRCDSSYFSCDWGFYSGCENIGDAHEALQAWRNSHKTSLLWESSNHTLHPFFPSVVGFVFIPLVWPQLIGLFIFLKIPKLLTRWHTCIRIDCSISEDSDTLDPRTEDVCRTQSTKWWGLMMTANQRVWLRSEG